MTSTDELEFQISQYVDGQLSRTDANAMEERLATDAAVRALLADYRALNDNLRALPELPAIDWTANAVMIRDAIDEQQPVRSYFLFGSSWVRYGSIAACITLLIGSGALLLRPGRVSVGPTIARVAGPQIESAAGPVLAQVSIGAPPAVARNYVADEAALDRPSVVLIDRADTSNPDAESVY